jgi:hypothetical protein
MCSQISPLPSLILATCSCELHMYSTSFCGCKYGRLVQATYNSRNVDHGKCVYTVDNIVPMWVPFSVGLCSVKKGKQGRQICVTSWSGWAVTATDKPHWHWQTDFEKWSKKRVSAMLISIEWVTHISSLLTCWKYSVIWMPCMLTSEAKTDRPHAHLSGTSAAFQK